MKLLALLPLLSLFATPMTASPVPVPAAATYGNYGSYPKPEGGYGSYAGDGEAAGAAAKPAPPPDGKYGSYGTYPRPEGGYGKYGSYKREQEAAEAERVA